jgi:hypothetical protein
VQAEHPDEFDDIDDDEFAGDDEPTSGDGFDDPEELDDLDDFDEDE